MKYFSLVLVIVFLSQLLFAWGKTGHRIVGEIAGVYLTKNAKMQVKRILGHSDLSRVSNWADEIKSDSEWKHTFDWHYINISDNESYGTGNHTGRAAEKTKEFISTLKNKNSSRKEKQIALKFLVHLIGDLHQPLHVGKKSDRGGNKIKVKWFGEETNLHQVWDSKMIQLQELSYIEYSDYLQLEIDYSDIRKWQDDSIITYVNESKELRKKCYEFSNENLKWEYFYKNKSLLEQRLLLGGVRLSGELNRIFK